MIEKIRAVMNPGMSVSLFWCVFTLVVTLSGARQALGEEAGIRVLIDLGEKRLSVLQGDIVKRTYNNISIGRAGSTSEKKRRDGKTPLGKFRIVRVTTDTPFHRFFGLDYPNLERAERARVDGTINEIGYAAIRKAIQAKQIPPQDTVLGGYIGIHGVGKGNIAVHRDFNWTEGCIALTNAQIDDLSKWVHIGTKVTIRR